MRKLLSKIIATWLAAFAIAGATIWAEAEEDAPEPQAAAKGRAAPSVWHHDRAD